MESKPCPRWDEWAGRRHVAPACSFVLGLMPPTGNDFAACMVSPFPAVMSRFIVEYLPVHRSDPDSLFQPITFGAIEAPNRFVMAPLTRCRASAGFVPHELNALYYAQRASAGLIVSEATQISQQGMGYPDTPGIYSDDQVKGWQLVTDAVHAA